MTDQRTPPAPPQPPSLAEQDARERRIWWTLVAIGVVIVLGIMLLMRPIIAGRLNAAEGMDRAAKVVAQSDTTVGLVDRTVHAGLSAESSSVVLDVRRQIPQAKAALTSAVGLLDAGFQHLTDDEQRRATITRAAATARIEMLDAAPPILAATQQAQAALPLATDAWNRTVSASDLEKQAVAAYDLKTASGLAQAATLVGRAEDDFTAAKIGFERAVTAYPAAGLGGYVTYVDQRLRQLAILKDAIGARQAGKVAQANARVASYNAAQAKNAKAAVALPATPAQAIADAYKRDVAARLAAFDKARAAANDADTNLKNL